MQANPWVEEDKETFGMSEVQQVFTKTILVKALMTMIADNDDDNQGLGASSLQPFLQPQIIGTVLAVDSCRFKWPHLVVVQYQGYRVTIAFT